MSTATSLRERILGRAFINPQTGCWEWAGVIDREGYGQIRKDGKTQGVHRVSYEMAFGPVPDSLVLDHLCRVRHCVNPAHLEAVTTRVNVLRGESLQAANAIKTHCPAGHPYDEVNTYTNGRHRYCRACHCELERKRRARRQP